MDIERIDEHTVKFFITVQDIEKRGFSFEDLWSDRQLGEKFMWELLEEVQEIEDIEFDFGIKVQVNITMNGLEFIVSNSFDNLGPAFLQQRSNDDQESSDKSVPVKSILENMMKYTSEHSNDKESDGVSSSSGKRKEVAVYAFDNFEDVIGLFKNATMDMEHTKIYSHKNQYYLCVDFAKEELEDKKRLILESFIEEYGKQSTVSVIYLAEYGKEVISDHVFRTINQFFN